MLRIFGVLFLLLLAAPPVGAQPAPAGLRGGVIINEILVDPNGSANYDSDGNGTAAAADEFVELFNGGTAAADLSGLELWDPGAGAWFVFPDGATVAAGGYALVLVGVQSGGSLPAVPAGSRAFDAGRGSGVINNGGDNVLLYDPQADQYLQLWVSDDPLDPVGGIEGFSATAQAAAPGEDFGQDRDGVSRVRVPDGGATIAHHDAIAAENASPGTAPGGALAITLSGVTARPAPRAWPAMGLLLLTFMTVGWYRRRYFAAAPG